MEYLGQIFTLCIDFMKTEYTVYGYTISFWGIFVFGAVCSLVCMLLGGYLNGK